MERGGDRFTRRQADESAPGSKTDRTPVAQDRDRSDCADARSVGDLPPAKIRLQWG